MTYPPYDPETKTGGVPLLTVFTDASFDHATRAGGWAVWAKRHDMPPGFWSGPFKQLMPGSNECEAAALANAARILLKHGYAGGDQHVIMQTDSQSFIRAVGAFCQTHSAVYADYVGPLLELKAAVRCLELRHVHAHFKGGRSEPRNHVNDRCDKAARKHMEEMRCKIHTV